MQQTWFSDSHVADNNIFENIVIIIWSSRHGEYWNDTYVVMLCDSHVMIFGPPLKIYHLPGILSHITDWSIPFFADVAYNPEALRYTLLTSTTTATTTTNNQTKMYAPQNSSHSIESFLQIDNIYPIHPLCDKRIGFEQEKKYATEI